MFQTPEFWVSVAFILLLVAFGKRVYHFMTQTLDEHSKKIADQLERADKLQEEALSLLNSYKEKHKEALEQAAKIKSFAENEVHEFQKTSERELERFISLREKALLERLEIDREEAKLKLRKEATEEALKIVESVISSKPELAKKLTEKALKEVVTVKLVSSHKS